MVGKIWLFRFNLLLLQNKRTNPNRSNQYIWQTQNLLLTIFF